GGRALIAQEHDLGPTSVEVEHQIRCDFSEPVPPKGSWNSQGSYENLIRSTTERTHFCVTLNAGYFCT
ncbi:MAG: hypothetical protein KDD15_23985, partial [Lewinella sp.]|nr:hypothetical protein [Lewinella sp.]